MVENAAFPRVADMTFSSTERVLEKKKRNKNAVIRLGQPLTSGLLTTCFHPPTLPIDGRSMHPIASRTNIDGNNVHHAKNVLDE